jgi:hypothetical protein
MTYIPFCQSLDGNNIKKFMQLHSVNRRMFTVLLQPEKNGEKETESQYFTCAVSF